MDGYFGYPITPQSEVLETLAEQKPWETTGMVVLQAESEVAAINMVYGGAGSGKNGHDFILQSGRQLEAGRYLLHRRCGTSLSGGQRDARRSGSGYYSAQSGRLFPDYQGRRHGDYHLIALAPASVQEMADFVGLAFDLAFKYRNPAIILADGVIGQMMEKVVLPEYRPQTYGKKRFCTMSVGVQPAARDVSPISSPHWNWIRPSWSSANLHLQAKYAENRRKKKHATRNLTQKMLNT